MVAAGIQLVSVFLLLGWMDSYPEGVSSIPPHIYIHTYAHAHTHTLTKQVVCPVEAQAPCHLDLLGSSETPPTLRKKERKKREREENFPLRKRVSSCCLWLNHESDATKPSSLLPVCFFSCVLCVCVYENSRISGLLSGQTSLRKKTRNFFRLIKSVVFFPHFGPECYFLSICSAIYFPLHLKIG